LPDEIVFEQKETKIGQKETNMAVQEARPKVKKLNKKILLVASSESPVELVTDTDVNVSPVVESKKMGKTAGV
jgi:hypothetical protein